MSRIYGFFERLSTLFRQIESGNEPWRFLAAAIILAGGAALLEIVFRKLRQRSEARLQTKGISRDTWKLSALLPSLRLASIALLLRIVEDLLILPPDLTKVLRSIEGLLLAAAFILVFFYLLDLLGRLRLFLPSELQKKLPDAVFVKLINVLRIAVLLSAVLGFIYSRMELFPDWLQAYAWWRYLFTAVVILVLYRLMRVIGRLMTEMVKALKETPESLRLQLVIEATIWPLRLLLSCIAVLAVKEIFVLPPEADRFTDIAINVLATLAVVIFIYRLVEVIVYEIKRVTGNGDNSLDETFIQLMRMLARLVVIIFGATYLIQTISGRPLSALLAGLGIGGLAVALAAQDTLKNFFGSITIMLDKPFKVGQRITLEGHDGIVEEVGFRSTRVRTLTGHLVTIPNEKMATSNIENIGQRPSIRRLTNITVTYDTPPDKVEKAVAIIKETLKDHEGMHPDFPPRVFFNEFNDTSLNILMVYWYHPPNYWDFLAFNERVNFRIMQAFEAEGIEFAFPTSTTYLAQDERRPLKIRVSGDFPADPGGSLK